MYLQSMVEQKLRLIAFFSSENYHFYISEISQDIAKACLRYTEKVCFLKKE